MAVVLYPGPKERKKKKRREGKRNLWGVPSHYRIVICYAFVWVKHSSQSSCTVLYYMLLTQKRNICFDSWSSLNKNPQLPSPLLHLFKVALQCLWYKFHQLINKNWNLSESLMPSSFTQICYYFNNGDIPPGVAVIWQGEVAACSLR